MLELSSLTLKTTDKDAYVDFLSQISKKLCGIVGQAHLGQTTIV